MAQTIAAQKGNGTVAANGTTALTLFTQSTGIATRVILNSVSYTCGTGSQNPRISLVINVNGTGNRVPVAIIGISGTGANLFGAAMFPSQQSEKSTMSLGSSDALHTNHIILGSGKASQTIGTEVTANALRMGGNNTNYEVDFNSFQIVPSQFWMNAGDVLEFRCFHEFASATVTWSFTTITES